MKTAFAISCLLALSLVATGCGAPQQKAQPKPLPAPPQPITAAPEPKDEVERLLADAQRAGKSDGIDKTLDAATVLLSRGDSERAADLLSAIDSRHMSSTQWVRQSVLMARVEIASARAADAVRPLANPAIQAEAADLPPGLQADLALTRAQALQAQGRHLDASRERVLIQPWLDDVERRAENATAILQALGNVSMATLEQEVTSAQSDDWRGWVELSLIARDLRQSPAEQAGQLVDWQRRYAAMPSMAYATELLSQLQQRIDSPRKVALLLPLTGKAASGGQAILEGYLVEHYRQIADGTAPAIAVMDTAAGQAFADAYKAAVADGAELIIGPLLKEDLQQFAGELQPLVPTIALNFSDAPVSSSMLLYQFGLDITDEVAQLESSAQERNFSTALVLTDNSPWSQRSVDAFSNLFQAHGGRVLATLALGDLNDYRQQLEQKLLVDRSRERTDVLMRLLGTQLETEPRRRHDLDLIALFADPVGARSIKPMLPFLYAGDIPMWATSQVHSTRDQRDRNHDLDSVRFLDMPWFSQAEAGVRESATTAAAIGNLDRLIALGVDAYRLQSRLALLDWMRTARLSGATGELQLRDSRHIARTLEWYIFEDGVAEQEQSRAARAPSTATQSREGDKEWQQQNTIRSPLEEQPKTGL